MKKFKDLLKKGRKGHCNASSQFDGLHFELFLFVSMCLYRYLTCPFHHFKPVSIASSRSLSVTDAVGSVLLTRYPLPPPGHHGEAVFVFPARLVLLL